MLDILWFLMAVLFAVVLFRQKHLLSPTSIFAGYSAIALPVAYLVSKQMRTASVFYAQPAMIPAEPVQAALLATAIAFAAFVVGRFLIPGIRISWPRAIIIPGRINWMLLGAVGVFLLAASQLVSQLGGLQRITSELGAVRSGELKGQGLRVYAVTMLVPTILHFKLISAVQQNLKGKRFWLAMCVLSSLLGASFGFRGPAVALLIQALCVYYMMTGRPTKKMTLLILGLSIPAVTMLGFVRILTNDAAKEFVTSADAVQVVGYMVDSGLTRVRGVETFSLMYKYIEAHEYGLFQRNIYETVVAPFPSFLVDKGVSLTEQIATNVYGNYLYDAGILKDVYGGVSYTYVSEGYWNAGFVGVMIYGLLIGYLFKLVEIDRGDGVSILQIIFCKAFAGFSLLLVEATQLGFNAIVVNVLLNCIVLMLLAMRLTPR